MRLTREGYPSSVPANVLDRIEGLRQDMQSLFGGDQNTGPGPLQYMDSLAIGGDTLPADAIAARLDAIYMETAARLDANEQLFFARQLEMIESKLYMRQYPKLKGREHFPINFEGGPGVEFLTYRIYDKVGVAKFGLDFTRVDMFGREETIKVHPLTDSYGWAFQEIRAANFAGLNLDSHKAMAAHQAIKDKEDLAIYLGAPEHGIHGAFTHPNLPIQPALYPISYASSPDQIIQVFNTAINSVGTLSKTLLEPNMLLLSDIEDSHIASRPRSDLSDTTIKEFLQKVHPGVMFDRSLRCRQASPTKKNILFVYEKNPEYMEICIPHDFETFPPIRTETEETRINCHERFAGAQYRFINGLLVELPQ